ncbi:hypothetical protein SLS56_004991 [Neofusicoccum ribis]|uniref:Glutaminase n=1 Tax=Neofusicoccum ribis TaxID=45134 RepID=A0ABR3SVE1_9PEZI
MDSSPEPDAPLKKPSFVGSILSRFRLSPSSKDQEAAPTVAPATQPQQREFTRLPFLNKIPPKWRLPLLLIIIMLAVTCIVLSAVLSIVLARESPHGNAPAQQPPNFRPLLPPAYPLAVRNPYLSAWIPGEAALNLPSGQAEFWRGQKLGWTVMAHVGEEVYSLFGMPNPPDGVKAATVNGAQYTSTRSIFYLTAGNADMTLSFLSPVFPGVDDDSLMQQSLPLSFLTVTAKPTSGEPDIKIYSDIGHEWLGMQDTPDFSLNKSATGNAHVWTWDRNATGTYEERENMAQWGQVFYASTAQDGVDMTMSFGKRDDIRTNFIKTKKLATLNAATPEWDNSGIPVSGYAHDLGKVGKSKQVVFGVGMTRDKGIKFYGSDHTYYYRAKYPKREQLIDAVSDAFNTLAATETACTTLDNKVRDESLKVGGQNYTDITTLSVRQVFGAMDITVPSDSLDTSKTNAWMKEISSNGDIQTLDIIYPAAPLFYWLSPGYIRLMLRPIAMYLEIGKWPHEWAVHDLGDRAFEGGGYPRAVGHDNGKSEEMPLESTGNLLILAYMYHKSSANREQATEFAQNHKALFTKYARYLENNGLEPTKQLSTNDGAGPLEQQTNLAIKAAVGLNAYGAMYGNTTSQTAAKDMANKIINKAHGMSSDGSHLTLRYGRDETWSVMFNLYPDVLLDLNTFPNSTIDLQSKFYKQLHDNAVERGEIGLPIDSRGEYGSSNWMSFAGASAAQNAESDVGRMFIDDIHEFISNRRNPVAFCDRYYVKGKYVGLASPKKSTFRARPVVGGHFAFLARAL